MSSKEPEKEPEVLKDDKDALDFLEAEAKEFDKVSSCADQLNAARIQG